jgi:hypothetical protein
LVAELVGEAVAEGGVVGFDDGDLGAPGVGVDAEETVDGGGDFDVEAVGGESSGGGSRPMGVSMASVVPAQRSKIQARTRALSP